MIATTNRRRGLDVALLIAVCSLVAACGSDATATPVDTTIPSCVAADRDPEACALVAYQGPDGLHIVAGDGTGDTRWQPAGVEGRPNHPDWSPDGARLAFVVDENDGTADIWVADADGGNARKLVDCVAPCRYAEEPAWSPDGADIVYWSNGDGYDDELRVADATTGATIRVIHPPHLASSAHPRWSPGGSSITADTGVFRDESTMLSMSVGRYDLGIDEPVPQPVTPADAIANFGDTSPDGTSIAYQAGNADPFAGGPLTDIGVIGSDGSGARRLTDSATTGVGYALPSWSADGTSLFVTVIGADGSLTIARLDVATGVLRPFGPSGGAALSGAHAVQCCR